jgi:two-component system, chemotaxis family, chemotaxis protein CheY
MGINVLVVDDSAVMRTMVIRALKACGADMAEIHQAADGQEGLRQLERHWVDLVMADINMPVMGGEEMIDRMRANPLTRDIPVIVVSTESSQARIELLEKKSSGFVHKPFSPEAIKKILDNTLGAGSTDGSGTEGQTVQGVGQDL